ncbi:MAG: hypothetical protein Q4F43_00170 [Eubacteriales bacterium]|nr:hypothetical protein [Eubacteriales bacterium]
MAFWNLLFFGKPALRDVREGRFFVLKDCLCGHSAGSSDMHRETAADHAAGASDREGTIKKRRLKRV